MTNESAPREPANFEQLMAAVSRTVVEQMSVTGEPRQLLEFARSLAESVIEATKDDGQELPPRDVARLRALFDDQRQLLAQYPGPSINAEAGLHHTLQYLLHSNFTHLVSTAGTDAARRAVSDAVRVFTRKPRGRPRKTKPEQAVTDRALLQKGKSYGEVALKTNRSRNEVRESQRYLYTSKKSK